jgi:hypothetical protein
MIFCCTSANSSDYKSEDLFSIYCDEIRGWASDSELGLKADERLRFRRCCVAANGMGAGTLRTPKWRRGDLLDEACYGKGASGNLNHTSAEKKTRERNGVLHSNVVSRN